MLAPIDGQEDAGCERYAVFSCTFDAELDNSEFVGWLATLLKARLGTGVIVVCGFDPHAGGIYDYWGVPADLRAEATVLLRSLAGGGAP